MKNPENLTSFDLDNETFRKEFGKITQAKIKEIREAREGLLYLKLGLPAYSSSEGETTPNFYSFMESNWLQFDGSLLPFFPETKEILDEDYISSTLHKLLSVDYVPPKTDVEIAKHLAVLESYYGHQCSCQPLTILDILNNSRLDLSLSKLMKYAYMLFAKGMKKGTTVLTRAKNTNLKKKARIEEKKNLVLKEYRHKKSAGEFIGKKRRQVATLIKESLNTFAPPEIIRNLPSLDTIERYFKTIPEIRHDFKEKGGFWYFQT